MALATLKSIRDTYVYSVINKNNGEYDKLIKNFLTKGVSVNKEQLATAYSTIDMYFKFPLKTYVLDAFNEGTVKAMIYPKGITANYKMPTSIPFILTKSNNVLQSVAVIDNWAKIDDDNGGRIAIDPNKLYCFLEGAYIARGLQLSYNTIRHNTIMYTEATSIYAHMFTRVLNREYSLNIKKEAMNKMLFLAAKFFMINLLQLDDSDAVFNYAVKAAGDLSPIGANRINGLFKTEDYHDLSTFIQAIARNGYLITSGLNELTVRSYVAQYIRMYRNSSLFSLEHLSYFIFNIIACINRAQLNDVYAWDAAIGTKSGEKLYAYIANAVSGR